MLQYLAMDKSVEIMISHLAVQVTNLEPAVDKLCARQTETRTLQMGILLAR